MNKEKLLERLATEFPLIVRTEYHVQIETTNGPHNIWLTKSGSIRFKPCGAAESNFLSGDKLIQRLRNYDYGKTDLALMHSLTRFIGEVKGKSGIFVDAGWKNGKAKVAIIKSESWGDMDITVRHIDIESSYAAEEWAVITAAEMYPGDTPIYSDCQTVADSFPRVQWIPRKQNKQADSLGNMRGNQRTSERKSEIEENLFDLHGLSMPLPTSGQPTNAVDAAETTNLS